MKLTDPNHPQVLFTTEVLDALDPMSPVRRGAFGVSCSERLFPMYDAFAVGAGWDAGVLRGAIDRLWHAIASNDARTGGDEDTIAHLMLLSPYSDSTDSPFTFGAQYAISCAVHAIRSLSETASDEGVWCSIVSRDCTSEYLTWVSGYAVPRSAFEDFGLGAFDWFESPMMRREISTQREHLRVIREAREAGPVLVTNLKGSVGLGIDPFGRKLVRRSISDR